MIALVGLRVMEVSTGIVTISWVGLDFPLRDAVIVVVPCATDVTNPAALIVATPILEEYQLTEEVIFLEVPSL